MRRSTPTRLVLVAFILSVTAHASGQLGGGAQRPAIMLTGYWPPSNEMLRHFSANPVQNPEGWIGADWEGRGYDVYAFFPEFDPPDCVFNCGQGMGDLEVDYQDTSEDFWPIADSLQPIAVITFSKGSAGFSWEVEMNQYNRSEWVPDYTPPLMPTPNPPDDSVPAGTLRLSALPVDEIVDAVNAADLGVNAFICFAGDGGGFLSEFVAYHGVWYQNIHDAPGDPARCIAGGHVHVGGGIDWDIAQMAAQITVRTVIDYVDSVVGLLGDLDGDGVVGIQDFLLLLAAWGPCPAPPDDCPADLDGDDIVGITDFLILLGNWG